MKKGFLQLYLGEAALLLPTVKGLALRASGAGLSVLIIDGDELAEPFKRYDVIIIQNCDLIQQEVDKDVVKNLVRSRPLDAEMVLCGTSFDDEIMEMADLISEVKFILI
ncbi:MAG: hypothetical protein FWC69_06120 [Defluviitaleaceae bacterium]|nr:hypothetical protein [Defluviitaleaceae bacterium]